MANGVFTQLDQDAIARVKAGIKHKPIPLKKITKPRPIWTYRAYWRNAIRENARCR